MISHMTERFPDTLIRTPCKIVKLQKHKNVGFFYFTFSNAFYTCKLLESPVMLYKRYKGVMRVTEFVLSTSIDKISLKLFSVAMDQTSLSHVLCCSFLSYFH